MEWLENVLDFVQAPLSGEPEFRWLSSGLGTKYLLITSDSSRPEVRIFGTADIQSLLSELEEIADEQRECVLLGVETWEVTSRFFRLDPKEAIERLTQSQER
ncbi:MAG: hypothetical protein ACE361_26025 [Aureliella sp.]